MMNLIRADFYRIVRGKAVYITFLVLLGLAALQVGVENIGRVGISTGTAIDGDYTSLSFNGMGAAKIMLTTMDNIVYILLPLFLAAAAPLFSAGTIKNGLTAGLSRVKLYISKLIVSGLLCVLAAVFYLLSAILLGTLLKGFGGSLSFDYVWGVLKPFASQLFILLAFNCVGIFLIFVTQRSAAVTGIYIALTLVPMIIVMMLSTISQEFVKLYNYDMIGCIRLLADMEALSGADVVRTFVVGAVYAIAATAAGIVLFKKAEIK